MNKSMKPALILTLAAALACCGMMCPAGLAAAKEAANPAPALTEGEMAALPITWERPVIIYNLALGRDCALRLRECLQPYFKERIGLYPCQKEGAMQVQLPEGCTRIFLELYDNAGDGQDCYKLRLGPQPYDWARKRVVSPMRATPAHLTCVLPHGADEGKVFGRMLGMLKPHLRADAEGVLRLHPVHPKDFTSIESPQKKKP